MENVYVKICNEGLMDVKALTLLGASTKRNDNSKIGFFGSGLKYALSVLLRNGIKFRIFSGDEEIKVTTKSTRFRDNKFDVICINGKETSMTTDMGPQWEPWFAIREIYCNSVDEGIICNEFCNIEQIAPVKDCTTFYVNFDRTLSTLYNNWKEYFCSERLDLIHTGTEYRLYVGHNEKTIVYRKGVRCYEEGKKSLYHYDLDEILINESRVLSSAWDLRTYVARYLATIENKSIIENIIKNWRNTFEGDAYWQYIYSYSNQWLDVIDGRILVNSDVSGWFIEDEAYSGMKYLILPKDMVNTLWAHFGDKVKVYGKIHSETERMIFDPNEREGKIISECTKILEQFGNKIKYPIRIARFKNEKILGEAVNDMILVSKSAFDMGKRAVLSVIIEEDAHLDSKCSDKTRGFQTHLINMYIKSIEDKLNIIL